MKWLLWRFQRLYCAVLSLVEGRLSQLLLLLPLLLQLLLNLEFTLFELLDDFFMSRGLAGEPLVSENLADLGTSN